MRRLVAAIVLAVGLIPATRVAADPLPYPPYDTDYDPDDPADAPEDVDFILELEQGENRETHADVFLDALGVDEDEREDRVVQDYECAINGVWLRLTAAEAREAEQMRQAPGVANAQVAFDVSIPRMSSDSEFEATMDRVIPNSMGGVPVTGGQSIPTGFQRVGAVPGDYSNVDIAILDTGVDAFNDDLNVVGGYNATHDSRGEEGWGIDDYGHGTHVAGIAAAVDNDRGVVGPAAGARIWSVPVLSGGSGSMASLLAGVDWVCQNSSTIEVANLSLGGTNLPSTCWSWDSLHNGFCRTVDLGPIFVVSAGNSEADAINFSPANYAELVTVSALTDYDGQPGGLAPPPDGIPSTYGDDTRALFSNYGSVVDFIAPGVNILSTLPYNTVGYAHGTSMASPEVTGVLAAWIAENGRDHAVESVLAWSSLPSWTMNSGWDGDVGPDHEPLIRFGAPSYDELVDRGIVEAD